MIYNKVGGKEYDKNSAQGEKIFLQRLEKQDTAQHAYGTETDDSTQRKYSASLATPMEPELMTQLADAKTGADQIFE